MSAGGSAYDEKRNFIRLKVNTPVNLTVNGEEIAGICKDLSGSGMMLQTKEKLNIGDEVFVSIDQQGGHLPFKASAEVARLQSSDAEGHIWGLTIKHIDE